MNYEKITCTCAGYTMDCYFITGMPCGYHEPPIKTCDVGNLLNKEIILLVFKYYNYRSIYYMHDMLQGKCTLM